MQNRKRRNYRELNIQSICSGQFPALRLGWHIFVKVFKSPRPPLTGFQNTKYKWKYRYMQFTAHCQSTMCLRHPVAFPNTTLEAKFCLNAKRSYPLCQATHVKTFWKVLPVAMSTFPALFVYLLHELCEYSQLHWGRSGEQECWTEWNAKTQYYLTNSDL